MEWTIGGDPVPSLGDGKQLCRRFAEFLNDVILWKNFRFYTQNFWWPFFSHRPWFSYLLSWFSISLLPVMSYMTLSSQEKPLFHKIILDDSAPFLLCSCFCTHPTNTTSQNIGGDGCMGRPPSQIFLGGPYPSSPRSPPVVATINFASCVLFTVPYISWCSWCVGPCFCY